MVLQVLLSEAVEALDARGQLMVRVNPEDEETMLELMQIASAKYPSLAHWTVKGDPSLNVGGMVVESDNGMVDNSQEGRRAVIRSILDNLSLPALDQPEEGGA